MEQHLPEPSPVSIGNLSDQHARAMWLDAIQRVVDQGGIDPEAVQRSIAPILKELEDWDASLGPLIPGMDSAGRKMQWLDEQERRFR